MTVGIFGSGTMSASAKGKYYEQIKTKDKKTVKIDK